MKANTQMLNDGEVIAFMDAYARGTKRLDFTTEELNVLFGEAHRIVLAASLYDMVMDGLLNVTLDEGGNMQYEVRR